MSETDVAATPAPKRNTARKAANTSPADAGAAETSATAPKSTSRGAAAGGATSGGATTGDETQRKRRRRGRRRGRGRRGTGASDGGNAAASPAETPKPAKQPARAKGTVAPVEPPGDPLADSLQHAVLRHSTAGVLARGRGYAKGDRVSDLSVIPGRIRARVRGSGQEQYRVELASPQRPGPAIVHKIRWSCDCPYATEHRRGCCKHVVAVAIVGARRLAHDATLRRRWMGEASSKAVEADPSEFDALAERMLAAFSATPLGMDEVLERAFTIAPPPFDIPAR